MVSALDTLLPPAWTSARPNLVGLWTQRMGQFFFMQSWFRSSYFFQWWSWLRSRSYVHIFAPKCNSDGALQPIFCIWFNGESILLLLRQDPEVARLAGSYLKWVSIGLPGTCGLVTLTLGSFEPQVMHLICALGTSVSLYYVPVC